MFAKVLMQREQCGMYRTMPTWCGEGDNCANITQPMIGEDLDD